MNQLIRNVLIFQLTFSSIAVFAQRPKVGLVLSGGGAKGISHIGILQAIDSAGLKIDYITGTSMGSIIGSLYAVGYSGNQIEEQVVTLDWGVLLSNKPKYTDVGLEEKDEFGNYSVEVGVERLKPKIATGLIESEELWLKLNEMFLPVYNIKDFSKFSIPFRCISTDLSDGAAIVHKDGEVVMAIRASMAIPSVFTAVPSGNTKLVDGGIIRNYPVTDVIEMGADIVIGVNLFKGLPDVSKLNNALDVMYQITQYRDAEDLVKEKKLCDLNIEPPVDQYSAGSFGAADDILRIGKEVGHAYYPYFKKLADSLNKLYPIEYDPFNRLPKVETIIIDEIEITGLKNTSKNFLLDKLNIHPGKTYTVQDINEGFKKAYSSRYYDLVHYELKPTTEGHAKLVCIVKETMMNKIKAALSFHSYMGPAAIINLTVRNLLFGHSRSYAKVAIGEYIRFYGEHRQSFGRKADDHFTLSFRTENLPLNIYEGSRITYQYKANFNRLDLNYMHVFGTNLGVGAGINAQRDFFKPVISPDIRIDGDYNFTYGYIFSEFNSTDRRFFPTKGHEFQIDFGVVFDRQANVTMYDDNDNVYDSSGIVDGKPNLYRLKLNYSKYNSISEKWVIFYNTQLGLTMNSQGFIMDNFFVGGVQPLFRQQMTFVGLNEGQVITSSAASALLGFQYNFAGDLLLIGRANGLAYNFSNVNEFYDENSLKGVMGYSLGVGYNLSVFPMEFNAMYSPEIGTMYSHVRIGFFF